MPPVSPKVLKSSGNDAPFTVCISEAVASSVSAGNAGRQPAWLEPTIGLASRSTADRRRSRQAVGMAIMIARSIFSSYGTDTYAVRTGRQPIDSHTLSTVATACPPRSLSGGGRNLRSGYRDYDAHSRNGARLIERVIYGPLKFGGQKFSAWGIHLTPSSVAT